MKVLNTRFKDLKVIQGITFKDNRGFFREIYRNTFLKKKKLILEAHIFGWKKNLYDKKIKIMLGKFIRNEKKFRNILELKKQIAKDIKSVKQV